MLQHSEEWLLARCGFVTASRFADVLTASRNTASQKSAWIADLTTGSLKPTLEALGSIRQKGSLEAFLASLRLDQLKQVELTLNREAGHQATKQKCINAIMEHAGSFIAPDTPQLSLQDLSQTAASYLHELVAEHLTGLPVNGYVSQAMAQGTEREPIAREAYRWHAARDVIETGFHQHPHEPLVGGSPDGLVGDNGMVEIKCPDNSRIHVCTILNGMPKQHMAQVQGLLWILDRQWCDFISFDPDMPPDNQLFVQRVNRDEEFISELESQVIGFRNVLLQTLDDFR